MSDSLKDYRKLCILNAKETETDDDIRNVCEEFAQLVGFNRPPNNKRLAFPLFCSPSDAAAAKEGLTTKGYRVDYAKAKPATDNGFGGSGNGRPKREEFRSAHTLNGGGGGVGSENGDGSCDINDAESIDNRPYGNCIKCGDRAYYNCGRCGDFYCSEECQASDWLTHKRQCFPMPKLMPSKSQQNLMLGKSMEKLKLNDSPIRAAAAARAAAAVGNSTDAADGHEAKPTPRVQLRLPTQLADTEQTKPTVKAPEPKATKPASVHSNADSPAETSDHSMRTTLSLRHKIVLSNCGDSAQSSTTAINRTESELISNGAEVFITHVRNYQTVYVRSVANDAAYMAMIGDVAAAAKTAPGLKTYPYPKEDTVLAPFDGAYYRALVLACNENAGQVRVGYIDFGNTQEVPFSTLKVLPAELKDRPRLTYIVKLKNLKDEPEPHELTAMKDYLEQISETGTPQVLKISSERGTHIGANDMVELIEVISNRSVNDHLNSLVQKRYYLPDLAQKLLKCDSDNLPTLMAIDTQRVGDNVITCLVKDDVKLFMEGDEETQKYGDAVKNAPAYKPKQKELCVSRVKDAEGYFWYRCMYQTELVDDRAQVYCIDYGKIDRVKANDIRAMTADLEHQITSIVCLIKNGNSVPSDKRTKFFNDHPEFQPLSIEFDKEAYKHVLTVDFSGIE